ncbi:MAG TPA: TetR/AcrR family transcriptional regulator [Spongiibacteraceae bacterium]|nr:TetR/AcrR family transcriptional regulator [Spongiibacteraceae bacterium]
MSTPPRPLKSDRTRQNILTAAETIFAELGFSAARLEDVAAAVGIRRASIVYYFKNKQELYDAVEADIFAALQGLAEQRVTRDGTALQRLELLLDCWLDFWVARPTAARIIVRNGADITPRSTNPVEFSETTLAQLETVIIAGKAAGEFSQDVEPMMALYFLGTSILNYVVLAGSLGGDRSYTPSDPARIKVFRAMLHKTIRALLC